MSFENEIYDFINDSRNEDSIEIDDYGNARFNALINYQFRNQNLTSQTKVKIIRNGYDDGKISFDENDELNVNFLHLDFVPQYQEYHYKSDDGSFTITGSSSKMSGSYKVTITVI